jgi:sugar/nucleoside kinase (ribokinase family)
VDLLVVGHVTRDSIDGGVRLGGAASYAALAAARLGYETALVTVAPQDEALLEPLRRAPRLSLHCVPDDAITTFALDYAGGQRRLWLRRRARALVPDDIPTEWRRPPVAYVGAVAGECDGAFVKALGAAFVGAGLQGWLRRTDDDGRVQPVRLEEASVLQDPPQLNVAIASEEDHASVDQVVAAFTRAGGVWAITRGARGATIGTADARHDIPAVPAHEVDPTGAGDVFGVVLTLELARGATLPVAGRAAAAAAARVVEGPGLGTLPASLPLSLR